MIRKPGSVLADHLSSLDVATKIERFTDEPRRGTIRGLISLQQTGFTSF